MKKIVLLLITIILCFTIVGCKDQDLENKKDAFIQEHEYYYEPTNVKEEWTWFDLESFKEALNKRAFVKLEYTEVEEKINNKESFIICYGFNPSLYQCPYCVDCLPVAASAASELGIDILYLDIYPMRSANTEEYLQLYNKIIEVIPDFGSRISAPTYMYYKEGVPYAYNVATVKDSDDKYIKGMNEEEKEQLKNIYLKLFIGEK